MARRTSGTDWKRLLLRWDKQQDSTIPEREWRFRVMLDVLEATIGRSGRVLDLGSGPGSLSQRMLQRFPRFRCVAVDYDPVVLRIGQGALGTYGGRLAWVDAKIGRSGWTDLLPRSRFDAAVSTTALHWLPTARLRQVYRDLGRVIRPGGVVLNGDRVPWGPEDARLGRLARGVHDVQTRRLEAGAGWGAWQRWWKETSRVPELADAFEAHRKRRAQHPKEGATPLNVQIRALRRAGFRTVAVVWQNLEDRVLFAQR